MIIQLSKAYPSRYGAPVIDRVDTAIFEMKYFAHCMACTFCKDWCCWFGADVDLENVKRLEARSNELEQYTRIPRDDWFDKEDIIEDYQAPGELWFRTNATSGACVFLNRSTRGCMLHSFSIEKNIDYHELKPFVCAIFPLSFEDGLLVHADEVEDQSLVCAGQGPSLFEGVRSELFYYFGSEFVAELDDLLNRQAEKISQS